MRSYLLPTLAALLLFTQSIGLSAPYRQVHTFTYTGAVGFGNEVCVVGDLPELGDNDPLLAPKLTWSPGDIWTIRIALPAGTTLNYNFVQRSNDVSLWCDPTDPFALTPTQPLVIPTGPPPPCPTKTFLYLSSWPSVDILAHDLDDGISANWITQTMTLVGPGRVPGESEFRIDLPISPGRAVEFVFQETGTANFDNAPAPPNDPPSGAAPGVPIPYQGLTGPFNYNTCLDTLLVQDGQAFSYRPAAIVSTPQIQVVNVSSSVSGIPSRDIRILLPRGYAEHPNRRYPLVLMHDGQNCFFPGGGFGTWDVDRITSYETSQGRVREAIIVAVDNSANRTAEYTPTGDTVIGIAGTADLYGQFLRDDVLPLVMANYRIIEGAPGWPDSSQTTIAGSSLGGLVSNYFAQSFFTDTSGAPDTFGKIGIFSPAYWAAPNYVATRGTAPKFDQQIYLYMGTAESSSGAASSNIYWADGLAAYDDFNRIGYPNEQELRFEWGCGGQHNEPTWSARVPSFLQFVLDPCLDCNLLTLELCPPCLQIDDHPTDPNLVRLTSTVPACSNVGLQRSPDLLIWNPLGTSPTLSSHQPWQAILHDTPRPPTRHFYRLLIPTF